MGLTDWLAGSSENDAEDDDDGGGDRVQKWRVVAQDTVENCRAPTPDGIDPDQWCWEGEPMTKSQFEYEFGRDLDDGVQYTCVAIDENGHPDFEQIEWTIEREAVRQNDEIAMLRQEIRELKDGGPTALDPETDVEDVLFLELMRGGIDVDTAREFVGLKAQLEQAKHGADTNYFEDVNPEDRSQILGATAMHFADSYSGVGELVEDAVGGLTRGVVGPAADLAGAAGDAGADDGTRQAQLTEAADDGQEPAEDDGGASGPSAQQLAEAGGLGGGPGAVDPAPDADDGAATDAATDDGAEIDDDGAGDAGEADAPDPEPDAVEADETAPTEAAESAQEPPEAEADADPGQERATTDGGEWRPQTPEALEAAEWNDLQRLGKDLGVYERGMGAPELRDRLEAELFDDHAAPEPEA